MPIDEASMAQTQRPAAMNSANAVCSSTGSGVVMPVLAKCGGKPTPRVPTMAQRGRALGQPPGGAGFAIGARDRHNAQRLRGVAQPLRGQAAGDGFQAGKAGNAGIGKSKSALPSCSTKTGRSAVRQGLGDKGAAIDCGPRPGNKNIARLHVAAVGAQLPLGRARAQPSQGAGQIG